MQKMDSSGNGMKDLTNLIWSVAKTSPGTAGMFLKAYDFEDDKKVYYKMSACDCKAK